MKTKDVDIEYTKEDVANLRAEGVDDEAIPAVGKQKFRRGGFRERFPNYSKKDSKARINIYIDMDVLEHFKKRAGKPNAAPYQTQINAELRKVMERDIAEEKAEIDETAKRLLDDDEFIEMVSKKIKERTWFLRK